MAARADCGERQLTPGTKLGDWLLVGVRGRGGTATVYEAHAEDGRRAALKVLRPPLAADSKWLERFQRETRVLKALRHPGVVSTLEVGNTAEGLPFFVMELLEGSTLQACLNERARPLPLDLVLRSADRVLDVLSTVHAAGIVHRDLKPGNLFLSRDGSLRVLDFGIAHWGNPEGLDSESSGTRGMLGTPAYMPPEQARARWDLVDLRSDIWAVGAVLFTLLSREHVHPAQTENEQLGLTMSRPARSLGSVRPDLDPALIRVVDRALAYDPRERWASAAAFRAALKDPTLTASAPAGESEGMETRRPESSLYAPARPERPLWRRAAPIGLAAVLMAVPVSVRRDPLARAQAKETVPDRPKSAAALPVGEPRLAAPVLPVRVALEVSTASSTSLPTAATSTPRRISNPRASRPAPAPGAASVENPASKGEPKRPTSKDPRAEPLDEWSPLSAPAAAELDPLDQRF